MKPKQPDSLASGLDKKSWLMLGSVNPIKANKNYLTSVAIYDNTFA